MKECEVMEVLSDHPDAFDLKFYYITQFIHVLETSFLAREGEDMCEKKKKYSINVVKLLRDKIRYEHL